MVQKTRRRLINLLSGDSPSGTNCNFASPAIALAPVTVVTWLLVEPVKAVPADIPVRLLPSMAGKAPVNLVASIVVEVNAPAELILAFSVPSMASEMVLPQHLQHCSQSTILLDKILFGCSRLC